MNGRKLTIVILVLVFLGGVAWVARSQEERPRMPGPGPDELHAMVERMVDQAMAHRDDDDRNDEWARAPLGRTIKLSFAMPEDGKQADDQWQASVVCATRGFSIATAGEGEGRQFGMEIEGLLIPMGDDDNAATILRFEMEMHYGERGTGTHLELEGSTIVDDRKTIELGRFGNRTLTVRVEPAR